MVRSAAEVPRAQSSAPLVPDPYASGMVGTIQKVLFRQDAGFFAVLSMVADGTGETFTATGNIPNVVAGDRYRFTGHWETHPKYGRQFKIHTAEQLMPQTVEGIEAYLGSGLIKGIGPTIAARIVEKFGTNAIKVITEEPSRLFEVDGIGPKKKEQIVRCLEEHKDLQDILIFLRGHQITHGTALKIYREYKRDTIKIVTENPYKLCDDIFGIGFKRADEIAQKIGIPAESPFRVRAAIKYALKEASETQGHVFLPITEMEKEVLRLLNGTDTSGEEESFLDAEEGEQLPSGPVTVAQIDEGMVTLRERNEIVVEGRAVYLKRLYDVECEVAKRLRDLIQTVPAATGFQVDTLIAENEDAFGIKYAPAQRRAIHEIFEQGLVVVTGGPGTGKTTLVNGLLDVYEACYPKAQIHLAAPTGRAAKRLEELTGRPASTIHRMLEYKPNEGFVRNANYPLAGDLLVVDETSMIDISLAVHLLRAIPKNMRVIFVGDQDQLPSVGPGTFLKDLIECGAVPVVRLTEIFRQAQGSRIVVNAHLVNSGSMPKLERAGDFLYIEKETPEDIADTVRRGMLYYLTKMNYPLEEIQVLSPIYRGPIGVWALNPLLQEAVNPPSPGKREITRGNTVYREGDKVIQLTNCYKKEVFNGNIGRITRILFADKDGVEEDSMLVDVDGRTVQYTRADLDELALAYCITTHKAQGSQFKVVLAPVSTHHYIMLQRNNLYTAMTRAEDMLVFIGTTQAIAIAVRNNAVKHRYSRLVERLRGQL